MNILAFLTVLYSSQWSTNCVMTQADGVQGYTIDQVVFEKNDELKNPKVTLTRTWFQDEQCSVKKSSTVQTGSAGIRNKINENTFEADWTIDQKIQLGVIAIADDNKSIRMATTSFGNMRNTMPSLFSYFAK